MKFYATKGPRKTTQSLRNVRIESSKSTQKKRKLKNQESDIAGRNAAMNSSGEALLREEDEARKRLRYPIGLQEASPPGQEASPPGQPTCPQTTNIPELTMTQAPTETISVDDASNLILQRSETISFE